MTGFSRAVFASLVLSGSLLTTISAAGAPQSAHLYATHLAGTEVDSIKNIERISDWQTLDTQHLTLRVNNAQSYLLTLQDPCEYLRGARIVGVSMTNQEIWADYDYIAADGRECRIDSITRLGRNRS